MYYFLSLLTGILISVMVAFNGGLTAQYGIYSATVIVHVTGLILIAGMVWIKRERPFIRAYRWYLYLGGAIGVITTVFNNFAFGRISVSAIMALGLFGQSIAGLIIDQSGWMGMSKHYFRRQKLIGLFITFCGIAVMVSSIEVIAVLVSFIAGITIVISRTLNARLSEYTSIRISTLYNYLVGLFIAVPVLLLLGGGELPFKTGFIPSKAYIYFGGIFGVSVVVLSNITVAKISAFYLSLLLFIGQVFSGIMIDAFISGSFSVRNLIGGVLVAIGLCVNLALDKFGLKI